MLRRTLAAALLALAALVGVQVTAGGTAYAAVRTLYYDSSQAQEFVAVVDQAAGLWNTKVTSVRLIKAAPGQTPNIRVYADNGWPRTYTTSLGNGRWYMGREAVNEGYYQPRIAAHEFGHILGLPDRRTGLCADLMSGSSAAVSCTNANPNARERAEVDADFRTTVKAPGRTYVWTGPAAA